MKFRSKVRGQRISGCGFSAKNQGKDVDTIAIVVKTSTTACLSQWFGGRPSGECRRPYFSTATQTSPLTICQGSCSLNDPFPRKMPRRTRAIAVKGFSHDAILREMGVGFVSLLRTVQG